MGVSAGGGARISFYSFSLEGFGVPVAWLPRVRAVKS